jgi:hypothetical protein
MENNFSLNKMLWPETWIHLIIEKFNVFILSSDEINVNLACNVTYKRFDQQKTFQFYYESIYVKLYGQIFNDSFYFYQQTHAHTFVVIHAAIDRVMTQTERDEHQETHCEYVFLLHSYDSYTDTLR